MKFRVKLTPVFSFQVPTYKKLGQALLSRRYSKISFLQYKIRLKYLNFKARGLLLKITWDELKNLTKLDKIGQIEKVKKLEENTNDKKKINK